MDGWMDGRLIPTLRTQTPGAVVGGHGHAVTQPPSMFGLWSGALSAALPLTLRAAERPLAPLAPTTVH